MLMSWWISPHTHGKSLRQDSMKIDSDGESGTNRTNVLKVELTALGDRLDGIIKGHEGF